MGKVLKIFGGFILLMVLAAVVVGLIGEDKVQNSFMRFIMSVGNSGSNKLFVDSNYSTLGKDPNGFKGDEVKLTGYLFNVVPPGGRVLKGNMEVEVYRGTKQDLYANPMNTTNRLWVTYNQTTLNHNPRVGSCVLIEGVVRGMVKVTTASGDTTYDTFIEASSMKDIPCSSVPASA